MVELEFGGCVSSGGGGKSTKGKQPDRKVGVKDSEAKTRNKADS